MSLVDIPYLLSIGPHYCWHRYVTGKYGPCCGEKTGNVPDRFKGATTAVFGVGDPHYEQPCLWIHAVSVGEVNAAVKLVELFSHDNPRWDIRVSTTTATGREIAIKHFGAENVFYYPLDFSWMVSRAFDRIRPTLVVLMELEIWPNFLAEAARRQVPVAVANARITERSVKRLSLVPSVARNMANAVEAWFAQTKLYADRLVSIGVPGERIDITGSIKYDAVPVEIDAAPGLFYRRLFGVGDHGFIDGGGLLLVAGSIHPGEEKAVLAAGKRIREQCGVQPRIVLVPRHPERLDEMEETAKGCGSVVRRSALSEAAGAKCEADIVLVDVMGELARIYQAADVVFVGGSLVGRGGQNFMEPCGLERPTVVGPNLWNFAEPAELLAGENALLVVNDADGLADALVKLAANPQQAREMARRARKILLEQRGAARRMADRINLMAREALARHR